MEDPKKQPLMETQSDNSTKLKGLITTNAEGRVLAVGLVLALGHILWLAAYLFINPVEFQILLGMTATEIVFGRIACMGFGYSMDISHGRVIVICMFLETLLVLVFYPLFVFTWRQLLSVRWLKRLSDRARKAAERHKDKVRKYGVIGLFMFVWLPFWMTGPVIGCMIGYLLGLRVWINLVTVLTGTYIAIGGWAWLLHELDRQTLSYSSYAIVIGAAVAAAAILTWTCRQHLRKSSKND